MINIKFEKTGQSAELQSIGRGQFFFYWEQLWYLKDFVPCVAFEVVNVETGKTVEVLQQDNQFSMVQLITMEVLEG